MRHDRYSALPFLDQNRVNFHAKIADIPHPKRRAYGGVTSARPHGKMDLVGARRIAFDGSRPPRRRLPFP
jgi:hypothetical protein